MKCKKCGDTSPAPRAAVPPWMQPLAILAGSAFRFKTVMNDSAQVTQVAVEDPTRVAIGFSPLQTNAVTPRFAPCADPMNFGFFEQNWGGLQWYDLFKYGPLVTSGWWVYSGSPTWVNVWEVYLTTGGQSRVP
jgi:hypothetical protein